MKNMRTCVAVAVLALGLCTGAHATYTTFSGVDLNSATDTNLTPLASTPLSDAKAVSFGGNLFRTSTEDFESQALGDAAGRILTFAGDGPSLTATLSTSGLPEVYEVTPSGTPTSCIVTSFVSNGPTDCEGRYSVPSTSKRFLLVDADKDNVNTFVVTFNQAIAAFGFYGIDLGDFDGTVSLELLNSDRSTVLDTISVTAGSGPGANGSVNFFGFVSDAAASDFYGVRFKLTSTTDTVDTFGFDNFTIAERSQLSRIPPGGNAPEPGTLLLLGMGLAAAASVSRRRAP